ncbi:hypothetical protein BWI17_18500 [Betaproteobacteria bacterium GR16-43]|nr:hypothetical protein BWI17_18500 [Betaproteobacteria bacterium GR16-43]
MTQPGFFSPRERGFTLIEIAIVIAIMGLLLTMMIGISASLIGQQRREATRNKLAQVETALALFVSQNQRLPCPADGAIPSSGANAGVERTTTVPVTPANQCSVDGVAGSQARGVVPWRTLGLAEADVTDGWGTRLTYRVTPEFARQYAMNLSYCDPAGNDVTAVPGTPANPAGYCNPACASPFVPGNCRAPLLVTVNKGLEIRNLNVAPTKVMDPAANTGAAYIVVSPGENRAGGYDGAGVIQAASGPSLGTEEGRNAANLGGLGYYVDDFPVYADGTGHFDDFVLRPSILTVATKAQLGPRAH